MRVTLLNKTYCKSKFLALSWFFLALSSVYSAEGANNKNKVILLGFDGLTETVIQQLLSQNKLNNIKFLQDHGSYGRIASFSPSSSPVIWTSIITGKKKEGHGITGFLIRNDEGQMMVANSSHRKTKALWNIFSERRMKVGIVCYFVTWPVEKVNGFMISKTSIFPIEKGAYPSPTKNMMKKILAPYVNYDLDHLQKFARMDQLERFNYFTPEMFKYLDQLGSELIPNYLALKNKQIYSKTESEQYREFFRRNQLIRRSIWSYFVDNIKFKYAKRMYKKDFDFFTLLIKGPDIVSHLTWQYFEPDSDISQSEVESFKNIIPNYYIFADRVLGYFLKAADANTTIILVSDHGFRKSLGLIFHVDKILNAMGYLDYDSNNEIKKEKIFDANATSMPKKTLRILQVNLNNIYPHRDHNQDESRMKHIVNQLSAIRVGKKKFFEKIQYFRGMPPSRENDIYNKTDESLNSTSGLYHIEGLINRSLYREVKRNPDKNRIVTINKRLYPLNDFFEIISVGEHDKYNGVVYFVGPAIKPDNPVKGFSVLDVTPAILKVFDLPIGADMAKGVPVGIFKPEFLIQHPVNFIKSYDEINQPLVKTAPQKSSVEQKIKNQLRSLGYIQ